MQQQKEEPSINLGLLKYRIDKKINQILEMLIHQGENNRRAQFERYQHRRIQTQPFELDRSNIQLSKLSDHENGKQQDLTAISIRIPNKTQGDLSIDGFPLSSRVKKTNPKAEKKIGSEKKSYTQRQSQKIKKTNMKMSDIKCKSTELAQTSKKNVIGKINPEIKLEKRNIFIQKDSGKKKTEIATPKKRTTQITIRGSILESLSEQIKKHFLKPREQKPEAYLTREKMLERITKNSRAPNNK